ncbi:unnamed protein product [Pedinophyceae sp. YPF-701]|nr:unnamed protein product [Pedinophyceae sp. YPF-701]
MPRPARGSAAPPDAAPLESRPGEPADVACETDAEKAARLERVAALYRHMRRLETQLGGGEGVEGLYGSISQVSMQKVIDVLKSRCGLGRGSVFLDVGAGLGRPILHAIADAGVDAGRSFGVEIDSIKCEKARVVAARALGGGEVPYYENKPIEGMSTLCPATHAYSFWEGVPHEARCAFGALFAASPTLQHVCVVQRHMREDAVANMEEYGFGDVALVDKFTVKMSGSGRSFQSYLFSKTSWMSPTAAPEGATQRQPAHVAASETEAALRATPRRSGRPAKGDADGEDDDVSPTQAVSPVAEARPERPQRRASKGVSRAVQAARGLAWEPEAGRVVHALGAAVRRARGAGAGKIGSPKKAAGGSGAGRAIGSPVRVGLAGVLKR